MRAPTYLTRRIGKNPANCRPGSARRNSSHEGQVKEGTSLLQQAWQIDPIRRTEFSVRDSYDMENHHADAVKHFERVVAIDASDPRAWDYLALNMK